MQIDLTPEVGPNQAHSPIQGDPVLNNPMQPLTFSEHTDVELTDVTFKGVIPQGLRFPSCRKLTIVGTLLGTQGIIQCIDPAYLTSLETLIISVPDAEEEITEASDRLERPPHLLTLLRFLEQIPSPSISTVRIGFNKVHLTDIITAFSPKKLPSELGDSESALSSIIFNKVSKLVQFDTKLLILPMKFLDDLDF